MENAGMNNEKSMSSVFGEFTGWCKKMLKKGCDTSFEIRKEDQHVFAVPVLVLVICGLVAFGLTLVLLIAGMFMGYQYRFIGLEKSSIDLNNMCQKASETCENIKNEFQAKSSNQ